MWHQIASLLMWMPRGHARLYAARPVGKISGCDWGMAGHVTSPLPWCSQDSPWRCAIVPRGEHMTAVGRRTHPKAKGYRIDRVLCRKDALQDWRKRRDSNPRYPFRYASFQDWSHQPLGHSSCSKSSTPPDGPQRRFALQLVVRRVPARSRNPCGGKRKCAGAIL